MQGGQQGLGCCVLCGGVRAAGGHFVRGGGRVSEVSIIV